MSKVIAKSTNGIFRRWLKYTELQCSNGVISSFLSFDQQRWSATATKETPTMQTVLPFNELPGAKGIYSVPFIGTMLQMAPFTKYDVKNMAGRVESWHKQYGDIFRTRLNAYWAVFLFNPDDIMTAYRQDGKYPHRITFDLAELYTKRKKREPSLIETNDEKWYQIRQPTQQKMLRPAAVANYVPILNRVADDFVDHLRKKDRIEDARLVLIQYATESVGMLCFNKRLGCLSESDKFDGMLSDLRQLLELFGDSVFHVVKPYRWFRTPFYNRYENIMESFFSITETLIQEAEEKLKSEHQNFTDENDTEPNLLKDLLTDSGLTKDQISRVLLDLFFTGIDTTSNSLTFLLYQLAKHQEIQEKLFEEINSLTPETGELNGSALNKMTYLHACLKESFRVIFPILFGSTRKLPNDVVLGGYNIPKGTLVIACNMFTSTDERIFERPKEYVPERWLRDEGGKRKFHPFATVPFGFGPRSCIGQRFAEQEIYIGVAKLIKNFRLRLPPGGEDIQYVYKTFTTTEKQVGLILEQR